MKKLLNKPISWGDATGLYSLFLFLFSLLLLMFSGCMTTNKARKIFDRNPGGFADLSIKHFPCIPDSAGKFLRYKPAGNIDYTGALDSVKRSGDSLLAELARARQYAADSIGRQCADLVDRYRRQVSGLAATLDSLQKNYRPPVPDTVGVPYPVKSTAEMTLIAQLRDSLVEKGRQISQLKIENADQRATISEKKRQIILHWAAHVGVLVLLGVWVYVKSRFKIL
ncbi:hypothetical protein SAMN04488128_103160 [Chitinophaga eiseniae]|uniref:Uncharacterized protein n=1 Tax=Chitinophaga eiseniae TaxID=634771 RepID=A0A1T4SP85_9BACT|nr:hypothetical protein [Chitinophaga eiseniae]SKA29701.1 hypothetical protein SAMN04488128_103160 [Chitinophaga eiseniae]